MEKKTEYKTNENGSFRKEETIRTTPEDGAVSEREIRPAALSQETMGKSHIGYSTTKTVSTNDPRITRLVAGAFSVVFFLIGVVTLVLGQWLFSVAFIAAAIFILVKSKKQIDAVAEKLKEQGKDVTIDSQEELEEVVSGVTTDMATKFKETAQETFTEDHFKQFTKKTLPIYSVIGVVVSVVLGIVIDPAMGIFVFALLAAIGVFYYCVLLKLLEKIFRK